MISAKKIRKKEVKKNSKTGTIYKIKYQSKIINLSLVLKYKTNFMEAVKQDLLSKTG